MGALALAEKTILKRPRQHSGKRASKKRNPPARQDLAGPPANRIILLSKVNSRLE